MVNNVEDPAASDSIFIFVDGREAAFPVAFDAENGQTLLEELPERELFPNAKMIEAMGATGELYCHEVREDTGRRHPELTVLEGDELSSAPDPSRQD